jgi:transcriptional regulator with XRE-family HTH domain
MKTTAIGQRLRAGRESKGLSLRGQQQIVGLDHATINNIESGASRDPSFARVVLLAAAAGVDVEELASLVPGYSNIRAGEHG